MMTPVTLSPEAYGWLASSLTLLTFMCGDMRRLRCAALAANAAFIAYGALAQLWPVLVLHLVLVPINLWRLAHAFRQDGSAAQAAEPRAPRRRRRMTADSAAQAPAHGKVVALRPGLAERPGRVARGGAPRAGTSPGNRQPASLAPPERNPEAPVNVA
jgi:hypothetical protein